MFDPTVGRWFEEDPEGLDAGPNLYEYVGNGPTNATDPSGLDKLDLTPDGFARWRVFRYRRFVDERFNWNIGRYDPATYPDRDYPGLVVTLDNGVKVTAKQLDDYLELYDVARDAGNPDKEEAMIRRALNAKFPEQPTPPVKLVPKVEPGISDNCKMPDKPSRPDRTQIGAVKLTPEEQREADECEDVFWFVASTLGGWGLGRVLLGLRAGAAAPATFPTRGMGSRTLSAAEKAEFDAFAQRAQKLGLVENPNRTGSWGRINKGKFEEATRIDVAEAGKPGWRGSTHTHIDGQPGHLDPKTPLPGE